MKTFNAISFAVLAMGLAQPALAAEAVESHAQIQPTAQDVAIKRGQKLYTASGKSFAEVYRVTAAGEPQVMIDERLITVPAATLSIAGAKLATSLSIPELRRLGR